MTITSISGSQGRMTTDVTGLMEIGKQYKFTLDYYVDTYVNQSVKNLEGFTEAVSLSLTSTTPATREKFLFASEVDAVLKVYAGQIGRKVFVTRIALQEVL